MPQGADQTDPTPDWQKRLADVMQMMREISQETDPQAMVARYGKWMSKILPTDRTISLSRRDLESPNFRITRFSGWKERINPWEQKEKLPLLAGGLLGDLLYAGEPRIVDELEVASDDPAAPYLSGQKSLMALPMLDQGLALNMVIVTRAQPFAFDKQSLPDIVWTSILFGRSTHNLVLAEKVRKAYATVDRELQIVGDIQRSLLPATMPDIPTLKLATHYQTSRRAGGDYYDFFPLPDGRWGILIADVSGHGTPAAVMMAVTHSIAHMYPGQSAPPSDMLSFVNRHLARRYTNSVDSFVTAFYGIYDPACRELTYSSAGHNPPRIRHCVDRTISALDGARSFPLGVSEQAEYGDQSVTLSPGDQVVFYTDGIVEAADPHGRLFGVERLDQAMGKCRDDVSEIIAAILRAVAEFTEGRPVEDDQTIVVAKLL